MHEENIEIQEKIDLQSADMVAKFDEVQVRLDQQSADLAEKYEDATTTQATAQLKVESELEILQEKAVQTEDNMIITQNQNIKNLNTMLRNYQAVTKLIEDLASDSKQQVDDMHMLLTLKLDKLEHGQSSLSYQQVDAADEIQKIKKWTDFSIEANNELYLRTVNNH